MARTEPPETIFKEEPHQDTVIPEITAPPEESGDPQQPRIIAGHTLTSCMAVAIGGPGEPEIETPVLGIAPLHDENALSATANESTSVEILELPETSDLGRELLRTLQDLKWRNSRLHHGLQESFMGAICPASLHTCHPDMIRAWDMMPLTCKKFAQ